MSIFFFKLQVYLLQRDRLGLVSYKANLHPQSEDYFYAEQVLRSPVSNHPNILYFWIQYF